MKKSTVLFAICMVMFFFSCKKDEELWSPIASGIIQHQGVTTYQYGTHILTDKNGLTMFALKSATINLDNYVNKFVEIQGQKYNPGLGGPDYIDVTKIR